MIDTTVEFVFSFTFGLTTKMRFSPRVTAGLGYVGNDHQGFLEGASRIAVHGQLLPVYVTDFQGGNVIPNVSIQSISGFDYLHPAPEPSASLAALAAIASVAVLQRARLRASR